MSFLNKRSSSGVFTASKNGFMEYKGQAGNGSINDTLYALGYHPDQAYTTRFNTNPKEAIQVVVFEIFSRNIIFVMTSKKTTYITEKDLRKHLGNFSVSKEFDSIRINEVLNAGLENASLSSEFIAKVLHLKAISNNGMFYSERIKTYLYFTEGRLTDFHFDDGLFPWSKYLKEMNPTVYKNISDTALKYWADNDFQIKKEINIQSEAWSNTPDALRNEYLSLHRTENGGFNFHMLRVCHYKYPLKLKQFKEINHGRFMIVEENNSYKEISCGKFQYQFDSESEELLNIVQLK
jgi:hypothetical protein